MRNWIAWTWICRCSCCLCNRWCALWLVLKTWVSCLFLSSCQTHYTTILCKRWLHFQLLFYRLVWSAIHSCSTKVHCEQPCHSR
jgi:hypothetical protein